MKRAVVYARMAREGDSIYDLEAQLQLLRKHAGIYDYQIVKEYSEIASGGGQDNIYNIELNQLVEDAKSKEFEIVLVLDSARISRRMDTCFKFIGEMEELGIKIITYSGEELRYVEPKIMQQLFSMYRSSELALKISEENKQSKTKDK